MSIEENLPYWRKYGAPGIITGDSTEPFRSMADGKLYTSKSKYRKEIAAQGYVEVGNESLDHEPVGFDDPMDDIREAIQEVRG